MSKIKLTEACNIVTGKLDANAAEKKGRYPYFTCAPEPLTINTFAFDDDVILLAGNNASGNFHCQRYKGKFNAYQRTYVITAKQGYDIEYIYYNLKINLQNLKKIAQGSQTKFLTMQILDGFQIEDISIHEQKKVTEILTCIDKKIENNNKINAELESIAKTIYDYWFLQYEFPNEEGQPYKFSGGEMVWNEELKKEIPKGWEDGTVEDVGEIVAGGTPSTEHPEYYCKSGIAWITPNDLSNLSDKYITHGERDISEIGLTNSSAKLMPKGTVLLTSRAPIGYIGIAINEVCTNQGFKSIVPNKKYGSEFIYYTIQKMVAYLRSLGTGSTFTEISKNIVAQVKIVLPEKNVVNKFEKIISEISSQRRILEEENRELVSLRDFLLPLLMNGQVGFKN